MGLTPAARRETERLSAERTAAVKADYRDKLERIQAAFSPPLRPSELSAGLDLRAPDAGISDVARFVSTSSRLRNAIPDRFTRTVIDRIAAGELVVAAELRPAEHRRKVIVCEPREAARMGAGWAIVNLAGKPIPRSAAADDWEDDSLWGFGPQSKEAAKPESAPRPEGTRPSAGLVPVQPVATRLRPLGRSGLVVSSVGLGGMRLSTPGRPDEAAALATLLAALDAGVRFIDSADVYSEGADDLGHNERLIARALSEWGGPSEDVVVATKAGLARPGGRWVPDGRPEHILEACERSLEALRVEAIDLYQLHVRDRRVPWDESVGALADLLAAGKVRRVGLCNVRVEEIEEARQLLPVTTVQNRFNPFDKASLRDGVAEYCAREGIGLIAHSPLGGHKRRGKAAQEPTLVAVAERHGVSPERVLLAWLLGLSPWVVVIPGATRRETIEDSAAAMALSLSPDDLRELDARFLSGVALRDACWAHPPRPEAEEVVMLCAIPAAGKSTWVEPLVARGYTRLNRDQVGGRLDGLIPLMREGISAGERAFVLDNTYSTRKSRAPVLATAKEAGLPVRCVWLQTSIEDASVNAARRMVERYGRLLDPEEIDALSKADPNMFKPVVLQRFAKQLEPPSADEGFEAISEQPFVRRWPACCTRRALFLDYDGTLRKTKSGQIYPRDPNDVELLPNRREVVARYRDEGWLLFGVSNQSGVATGHLTREAAEACFARTHELLGVELELRFCPHPYRPVGCWCRKPLPGMGVELILEHGVDPAASVMVGDMDSDRAFAEGLGIPYVPAETFFSQAASSE